MNSLIKIAAALIAYSFLSGAHAFDFKGIKLGDKTTPDEIFERLLVNCGEGAYMRQVCNGPVTIARERAEMNLVLTNAGVVQRISLILSPDAFEDVAKELIRKFGKPSATERSIVQNRMGAKFRQIELYWRDKKENHVIYSKYSDSLDSSFLYFSTKEDRDQLSSEKKNRKGDI